MTDNTLLLLVFKLAVLLFSVIVHEVSHGLAALRLGDDTAQRAGRLTLNPVKHLDFFGSFLLPISLFLISNGAFVIGWAKPVPYDPNHLKNPKKGSGIIAAVGPLSNLFVAIIFAVLIRFLLPIIGLTNVGVFGELLSYIVLINVLLAVFNLVPLPPLDGSGILFSLLPDKFYRVQIFLQTYGFFLLILFIFFGFNFIIPIVSFIYNLLVVSSGFGL